MEETKSISITSLITIPAVITLGITILRLAGELEHWPKPWFSAAAGGGGAIVGISWLPIIFGPYFAMKLAGAGDGPSSAGKAIGFAFLGLVLLFLGGWVAEASFAHHPTVALIGLLLMLVSAFIPGIGWRSLGNTLLAYAFAARIPVLIVMLLAMLGNGRQGWGTHYDAAPPNFPAQSFAAKFLHLAVFPQMTLWIGWTVVLGAILGGIVAAIAGRGKQAAPAAGPAVAVPANLAAQVSVRRGGQFSLGAVVVGLVCFFLPWFQVSCAGQRAGQVSGWELAAGMDMMGHHMTGDAYVFLVLLALLALLLVLGIPLLRGQALSPAPAVLQVIAGGVVALIPLIEMVRASRQAQSPGNMGAITFETQPGLWATVLCGAVLALVGLVAQPKKPQQASGPPTSS